MKTWLVGGGLLAIIGGGAFLYLKSQSKEDAKSKDAALDKAARDGVETAASGSCYYSDADFAAKAAKINPSPDFVKDYIKAFSTSCEATLNKARSEGAAGRIAGEAEAAKGCRDPMTVQNELVASGASRGYIAGFLSGYGGKCTSGGGRGDLLTKVVNTITESRYPKTLYLDGFLQGDIDSSIDFWRRWYVDTGTCSTNEGEIASKAKARNSDPIFISQYVAAWKSTCSKLRALDLTIYKALGKVWGELDKRRDIASGTTTTNDFEIGVKSYSRTTDLEISTPSYQSDFRSEYGKSYHSTSGL